MHRCAPHRYCFTGNVVKEAFLSGNALYLFIEYARKGPYIKCARSFYYPVPPPAIMMSNKIRTHGNDIGINDYWSNLTWQHYLMKSKLNLFQFSCSIEIDRFRILIFTAVRRSWQETFGVRPFLRVVYFRNDVKSDTHIWQWDWHQWLLVKLNWQVATLFNEK